LAARHAGLTFSTRRPSTRQHKANNTRKNNNNKATMSSTSSVASLNNSGVASIVAGNYKQAVNAFRAAAVMLKQSQSDASHSTSSSGSSAPASSSSCDTSFTFTVRPLQYEESNVAAYLSVMQYGASLTVVHPIALTCSETSHADDSVVSAILAYNHGLAYYCISRTKKGSSSKAALSHANGHLQRAHEQLMTLSATKTAQASSLMLLSMEGVVVSTLSQTLMEEGLVAEAARMAEAVSKMCMIIELNMDKRVKLNQVTAVSA
jgi:hypothetical protein